MRFRTVTAALLAAVIAVMPVAAQQATTQQPTRRPDIHWVPTPPAVVDAMLKLADVKPTDVVYDLGCGDGIIVATAAQKYGARAVGIDIDPQRVQEATERARKMGVSDKVTIKQGDLFESDIKEAVEDLPENFRLPVLLADLAGFSYKEIADILDIPIGTVMSRLHRGRKAMEKSLWDYAVKRGLVPEGAERP